MPTRTKVVPSLAVGTAILLGGCSILNSDAGVDPALGTCPTKPIVAVALWDASGSSTDSTITESRMRTLGDIVHRTALCGGRLLVSAFTSSSSASATVYDQDLSVPGATDQAKSRRVDEVQEEVLGEINTKLEQVTARLPQDGSDITSALRLMAEYAAQHPDSQLDGYLLTDGFNNITTDLADIGSQQAATEKAGMVAVPNLTGAWLTVAGIGRVSDQSASSAQAENLVAFYTELCIRSDASECVVVTDYSVRW